MYKSFPTLSIEKLKIFYDPQIHELINDWNFTTTMINVEASAWCFFVSVVKNFLDNDRQTIMKSYKI